MKTFINSVVYAIYFIKDLKLTQNIQATKQASYKRVYKSSTNKRAANKISCF
jgi:hypothetical protein